MHFDGNLIMASGRWYAHAAVPLVRQIDQSVPVQTNSITSGMFFV